MSSQTATTPAPTASTREDALFSKVTMRLLPLLFVCYVAAYLDRTNIGFVKAQMQADLGFSDLVYGLGAGIFFAGYFFFEVPSNLMLARIGVRKTLLRIMVLWGLLSAGMVFVSSPPVFYVMRFLLGAAEAGFFPGVMLYLTYWFPASRRGRIIAIFFSAIAVTGVIGGPLSGLVMSTMSGLHGLDGWQWAFVIEGIPACLLGLVAYFYFDNGPEDAKWLNRDEKAHLKELIEREQVGTGVSSNHKFSEAVRDPRVYALAFSWFTFICAVYVISFWLPTFIRDAGVTDSLKVGMLSAIPYGAATFLSIAICRNSDRTNERRWHILGCSLVGAFGLVLLSTTAGAGLTVALVVLSVSATAILTTQPLFWAITTKYLGGSKAAAGGIAFINCIGLTGGFVSPSILGWIKSTTGHYSNGLYFMAALLVIGGVAILFTAAKPQKLAPERVSSMGCRI